MVGLVKHPSTSALDKVCIKMSGHLSVAFISESNTLLIVYLECQHPVEALHQHM